jgi:hypothetical protein
MAILAPLFVLDRGRLPKHPLSADGATGEACERLWRAILAIEVR